MKTKTMAFRDVTAEISSESRFAIAKVDGQFVGVTGEMPERLGAAWIKSVCERMGVERFEVTTIRRLYWQRAWEMGAHSGEWERRQTVGVFPRGGHGVFETKVKWPSY